MSVQPHNPTDSSSVPHGRRVSIVVDGEVLPQASRLNPAFEPDSPESSTANGHQASSDSSKLNKK
jgi:hypothetical protein